MRLKWHCGFSLQNIVVRRSEDAKELISFLKEKKLGRASFLPLEAMKPRKLDKKDIKLNGLESYDINIASEVVKCDNKYINIINYLLGSIVIVDNNDIAIKLARQNKYAFKIVTKDGDIINPSGLMTGGYVNKSNSKILR